MTREITPDPTRRRSRVGGQVEEKKISVADAVIRSFEKVGGEDYLTWLAGKYPGLYAALLARVIPAASKVDVAASGEIKVEIVTGIPRRPTDPPTIDVEPEHVQTVNGRQDFGTPPGSD